MDETVIRRVKVFWNSSVTLRKTKNSQSLFTRTAPCGRRWFGFSACNCAVYIYTCVPLICINSALMCPHEGNMKVWRRLLCKPLGL